MTLNCWTIIERCKPAELVAYFNTFFFFKRHIVDMLWDKNPETFEVFYMWQPTQDKALLTAAQNCIFFFYFWNVEMKSFFRSVDSKSWPGQMVITITGTSVLLFLWLHTHTCIFFFFLHDTYLSGSIGKDSVYTCSCEKRSYFRASRVMYIEDHVVCPLSHSTALCVRITYTECITASSFFACCHTSQSLC